MVITAKPKHCDPRLLIEALIDRSDDAMTQGRLPGRTTATVAKRSVTINASESPLGWLLARGHLSERQYLAGERLRIDWERGHYSQRARRSQGGTGAPRSENGKEQSHAQ